MQQVAAQFAGRDSSAQDIANAWRQALGGAGANPFESLFTGMRGPGLEGLEQWSEAAKPFLQGMRSEVMGSLATPTFGFTREHQERQQALVKAQLQWQDTLSAYNTLMGNVSKDAYARFETKLAEREEPGRQLTSARALFDLWVDAAEEAFAESALSPEYRQVYGAMVNAQMTLRSGIQRMAEESASSMGMPGRTELDSAHRKIADLERQMRRMQRRSEEALPVAAAQPAAKPKAPKPAAKQAPKVASKPVSKATPLSKAAAAPKAVKKATKPVKKAPVRKTVTAGKPAKPASRNR